MRLAALTGPPARRGWRRWAERVAVGSVWLYLAVLVASWFLMHFAGDRWWFATLVLFGPRWLGVTPLLVLVPAAALLRRRLLWVLALAGFLAVGPIMGLCVPWERFALPPGPSIRVLTCNVKGHSRDNAALDALIRDANPDIVALQGCWGEVRVDWPSDWDVRQEGAVLIASRYRLRDPPSVPESRPPHRRPRVDMLHCVVESPGGDFPFVALHLPSPHHGISTVLDRSTVIQPSRRATVMSEIDARRRASEGVSRWVGSLSGPVVLAGDFNLPTDSAIYREYWSGFSNAFSRCGFGFGYTEWPTTRLRLFGIRIDHVLTGPEWQPQRCWVGPDIGSDHLPVIADLGYPWGDATNALLRQIPLD
jgi:endonuclease/exonuclease/phosphatase (EEP) superfamily protein YafD